MFQLWFRVCFILSLRLLKQGYPKSDTVKTLHKPLSADRGVLRKILLEGIEDRVSFGWRFQSYVESKGIVVARFENGSEVEGSALVGADGVWSRMRQQLLPSYRLLDSQARLVFGKTLITESLNRQFSETALKGLTYIRDVGLSCLLEPMHFSKDIGDLPTDYVYWVLFMRCDAGTTPENIMSLDCDQITTLAQQLTSNWHPSLRSLFNLADPCGTSVLRILSANPRIPDWAGEPLAAERITLIGDSAHAMAPTAALGATTALQDAFALKTALQLHGAAPRGLREYEALMRNYAGEALQKSLIGGRAVFGMRQFEELPEVTARSCLYTQGRPISAPLLLEHK